MEEMARTVRQFHERMDIRSIVAAANPALHALQQFQNNSAFAAVTQFQKEMEAFKAVVGQTAIKDAIALIQGPNMTAMRDLANIPAIKEMRKLQEDVRGIIDLSGVRSLLELQRQTQFDIAEMLRGIEIGPNVQAVQSLQPVYDVVADLEGQWELLDLEPDSDKGRQRRQHFLKEFNNCLDAMDDWATKHPFRNGLLFLFLGSILLPLIAYFSALASAGDVPPKELQKTENKLVNVCIQMQAEYMTVRSSSAPVRDKGNGGGEILFYAKNGETFCELQRTERWVLVQSFELDNKGVPDTRIGWIRRVHLKPAE